MALDAERKKKDELKENREGGRDGDKHTYEHNHGVDSNSHAVQPPGKE